MKKLEKLSLKEMSERLRVLDMKSCSSIQAGESPGGEQVTTVDAMLSSFYGNSTLQQLANFAEDVSNGIKDFGPSVLTYIATSVTQDLIMKTIEKAASYTPLKYLEYMPKPDEWCNNPTMAYGSPGTGFYSVNTDYVVHGGTGGSSGDRNDICTE